LQPVWYYLPILLVGFLPATLLFLPFLRHLGSAHDSDAERRSPELGFMLLAGLWCVLFFSLSGCKLPTYILPAFPFLALALGTFVSTSRWHHSLGVKAMACAAFVVMGLFHHVALPWYAWYRAPAGRFPVVSQYCADRSTAVICFPRPCDSMAFYLRRHDLRSFRTKQVKKLRAALREQPRTVVLCTHRHSLQFLRQALPPELKLLEGPHFGLTEIPGVPDWLMRRIVLMAGETSLGLCDLAVVVRR
jgi:4-amino-4-deoxy-L-arabinose transferase-like glycosyltransferase